MIPTPRLRFVTRSFDVPVEPFFGGGTQKHSVRVLQQWWESRPSGVAEAGEWRDVPLEDEVPK